jgi:orotidine-5'-phosphate decarboxylase
MPRARAGSRPAGAEVLDQKRFLTPEGAWTAGADIVILGRPVTAASDRIASLQAVTAKMQEARSDA